MLKHLNKIKIIKLIIQKIFKNNILIKLKTL